LKATTSVQQTTLSGSEFQAAVTRFIKKFARARLTIIRMPKPKSQTPQCFKSRSKLY